MNWDMIDAIVPIGASIIFSICILLIILFISYLIVWGIWEGFWYIARKVYQIWERRKK